MRVIYRSASRLRRISGWQHFFRDFAQHALNAILLLVRKHQIGRLLLNLISWLLVPFLLPLVGVLALAAALHKYALQRLLDLVWPSEQLEVEWNTGDIVTVVMLVEGTLDRVVVKNKLSCLIEDKLSSTGRVPKITKTLTSKLGFRVWKKNERFDIDDHVIVASDRWRGKRLTEETLRFYVNEICSFNFPCNHPPWNVFLIPYTKSVTLTLSHAVVIRLHSALLGEYALEDVFPCDTTNINLKKIINKVFQDGQAGLQLGWLEKLRGRVATRVPVFFESPRILLTDLLCSCRRWAVNRTSQNHTSERNVLFWSDGIPNDLVRKIKDASGTTSNVVLLSCVAGALRRYFQMTGVHVPEKVLCLLPVYNAPVVSVRQEFPSSFHSVALPLGRLDPVSRLHRLQSRIQREKEFPVRHEVNSAAARFLPLLAVKWLFNLITRNYPLVLSNSFVSSEIGNFLETPVSSICYWNSFLTNAGLSLSLIHYADRICLSAMSKRSVLQWPDLLVSCFQREVYDLALALNVRIERKPSPPSSPTRIGRSLSALQINQ